MKPKYLAGNMAVQAYIICIFLCMWPSADCYKDLNVMAAWKTLEYGFISDADRQHAVDNGFMVNNNTGVPIDVDVFYRRSGDLEVFTTIPRFTSGIPFTLAAVSSKLGPNGPVIYPYPDYSWHRRDQKDCNKVIISAFRVAIDDCHNMWIIDSGVDVDKQVCPPKVLAFDLLTDSLFANFKFNEDLYTPGESLFVNTIIRVRDPPPRGRCINVLVYVADINKNGLVVFDSSKSTSWRIENELMNAIPEWSNHTIAGQSFELMDGLFSLNLTPLIYRNNGQYSYRGWSKADQEYGYLYFHALSAETENKISLSDIDKNRIWKKNKNAMPEAFIEIGRRGTQSSMEVIDGDGILYTSIHNPLSIVAWDTENDEFDPSNFRTVANNPEQLQFASGMKIIRRRGEDELWVLTCRFQKIATDTLDPNEINFRILACRTNDLNYKSECRPLGAQTGKLRRP